MTIAEGNVGIAFGLTVASGSACMIGASVVYFPALVKRISRRALAGSLGLSAGVMLYFALIDVMYRSLVSWRNSGMNEDKAYTFSTICLFCGILLMKIVEVIVNRLAKDHGPNRTACAEEIQITWNEDDGQCEVTNSKADQIVPHGIRGSDPLQELSRWQEMADNEIRTKKGQVHDSSMTAIDEEKGSADFPSPSDSDDNNASDDKEAKTVNVSPNMGTDSNRVKVVSSSPPVANETLDLFRAPASSQVSPMEAKKRLVKMSLSTALAIAIHNFPEGLATFVAALQDPASGLVFALAVGIHNIPEGLSVALPIYYATGSRGKAFAWASLATISEVLAAFLAWIFLAHSLSHISYAILFGLVGGMLVNISIKELIPTAHRYDPEDTVVTSSVIIGMGIMAVALVLFGFEPGKGVVP